MADFSKLRAIFRVLTASCAASCGPTYSPDTYSTAAVQQANKVEQGVVVGVRKVDVATSGTIGAATGGAAGGIVGSQAPGGSFSEAVGALSGTVIGGIVGTTIEHTATDTSAYEYVVKKPSNDLVSVTQKDAVPLAIGEHVLVIAGAQARIVPDYTVSLTLPSEKTNPANTPPAQGVPATQATPPAAPAPGSTLSGQGAPLPPARDSAGTSPPPVPVASQPLPPAASPPGAPTPLLPPSTTTPSQPSTSPNLPAP